MIDCRTPISSSFAPHQSTSSRIESDSNFLRKSMVLKRVSSIDSTDSLANHHSLNKDLAVAPNRSSANSSPQSFGESFLSRNLPISNPNNINSNLIKEFTTAFNFESLFDLATNNLNNNHGVFLNNKKASNLILKKILIA